LCVHLDPRSTVLSNPNIATLIGNVDTHFFNLKRIKTTTEYFLLYQLLYLLGSRITESTAYFNQMLLTPLLYINIKDVG
jgi:hypothetical protein